MRKPIDPSRVFELALSGLRAEAITRRVGVSLVTFKKRLREDDILRAEYTRGRSSYAESTGRRLVQVGAGQSMMVQLGKLTSAETRSIKADPEGAVRAFIGANPGATVHAMRRGLRMREETIMDHVAVLLLDRGAIRKERNPGEELTRFYPALGGREGN